MAFSVGLGLTNECNLRCPHCYRPDMVVDRLSLRDVQQVCESIPVRSLNLGVGENGLHPEYHAILDYAATSGIRTSITSNGLSIDVLPDDAVRRFHSVEVSLDFPTEREHDAFRDSVRAFCEKNIAPHHAEWETCRLIGGRRGVTADFADYADRILRAPPAVHLALVRRGHESAPSRCDRARGGAVRHPRDGRDRAAPARGGRALHDRRGGDDRRVEGPVRPDRARLVLAREDARQLGDELLGLVGVGEQYLDHILHGDGVVVRMPAVIIGDHGRRHVADLGFPRQLGFLQIRHADHVHPPAPIYVRFGLGREGRPLHAQVGSAAMAADLHFFHGFSQWSSRARCSQNRTGFRCASV